jgi:hypothetical protein
VGAGKRLLVVGLLLAAVVGAAYLATRPGTGPLPPRTGPAGGVGGPPELTTGGDGPSALLADALDSGTPAYVLIRSLT